MPLIDTEWARLRQGLDAALRQRAVASQAAPALADAEANEQLVALTSSQLSDAKQEIAVLKQTLENERRKRKRAESDRDAVKLGMSELKVGTLAAHVPKA